MRKVPLVVLALGLVLMIAPPGVGQGCGVELVSMHRLSLPVAVGAGVKDLHLAVDERGTMYVGFSSWQREGGGRVISSPPQIVSYDANGHVLRVFERPAVITNGARWVRLTSLVYARGRIYATAQWHAEQWRGALFLFETSGELRRTVMLDELENPRLLVMGSHLGVIGTVRKGRGEAASLLRTFSLDGEKLSERVLSESLEPRAQVLSDESGRLLLVETEGAVGTLMPRRTWMKVAEGFGHITAAFTTRDAVAVTRVDPVTRRTFLLLVDERGERCEVETTGHIFPMVRGADGFFYGFGQVGVSAASSTDHREIFVSRFRIVPSRNAQ